MTTTAPACDSASSDTDALLHNRRMSDPCWQAAFEWAPRAAAFMARHAASLSDAIKDQEARRLCGLNAAWQAWCDVGVYKGSPPLHSKCIGFALPGEYYAVYLMDRTALMRGEYAYGKEPCLGWPCVDGMLRAYDSSALNEHVYQWQGDYTVEARPWFLHGRNSPASGSWTPPYADPVTGELVVSFVAPLQQPEGAVVIAGTWAVETAGEKKG